MSVLEVRGRSIYVDIAEELSEFDWINAKWTDDKLIASSPFRDDRSPSFWCNITGEYAGVFGDSSAEDDYYRSGTLPKLLAFLRDESQIETEEYLLQKYDYDYTSDEIELIKPSAIDVEQTTGVICRDKYDKPLDSEYLPSRGIHKKIIELQGVFDNGDSVGIPWSDMSGDVCAIKYRHKRSKYFWYEEGGTPLSRLVYGLDVVVERGIKRAFIVEAEVDALTIQSAGVYAIAIGGARFNDMQAQQIISSGLEEVILCGDNDAQGRKFNELVADRLRGYVDLKEVSYNSFKGCKDVNELGIIGIRELRIIPINTKEIRI